MSQATESFKLFELQSQVGLSESATERVLSSAAVLPQSVSSLPLFSLLLLERFEATVPLLRSTLAAILIGGNQTDQHATTSYLYELLSSEYYHHRRAVPSLVLELPLIPKIKRDLLKKALLDSVAVVVCEAARAIIASVEEPAERKVEGEVETSGSIKAYSGSDRSVEEHLSSRNQAKEVEGAEMETFTEANIRASLEVIGPATTINSTHSSDAGSRSTVSILSPSASGVGSEVLFDREEFLDIIEYLSSHDYIVVRLLAVDAIVRIGDGVLLREKVLRSNRWRMRLRAARFVEEFTGDIKRQIVQALKNDHIEEVRLCLAASLKSVEFVCILDDESDRVRAAYLQNVINSLNDASLLKRLSEDPSWEVKKLLLNLRGEWLHVITIPLIRNSRLDVKWRIRYDVLNLIEEKISEEDVVRPLFEFIVGSVQDRVCEIRKKAGEILVKIIGIYPWTSEYKESIERVVKSENYLHRISILPAAMAFDKKTGSNVTEILQNDPVRNVREYYAELAG